VAIYPIESARPSRRVELGDPLLDGAFAGTLSNESLELISLVTLSFYLRGDDGLLFERLAATHPEALPLGSTWDFRTSPPSGPYAQRVESLRFALGSAP
jgi:hypothetical protein